VSNPGAEIEERGMYSGGDSCTNCAGTKVILSQTEN